MNYSKPNAGSCALASLFLTISLAGCGGGSDSGSAQANSSTTPPADNSTATPTPTPNPIPTPTPTPSPTPVPAPSIGSWPLSAQNDAAVAGKEPTLPTAVCATVNASLTRNAKGLLDNSIDATPANSQPDASRIQSALNSCANGQAVKLVTGANGENAFLSGPLTLKAGVTLWIDSGITLFASRSPVDYQIAGKNTCGATSASDNGCSPLISITPNNSGVVGDGTIDGRGGAVMTSGTYANTLTWWDVGALTKTMSNANQNNPRLIQVNGGSNFVLYRTTLQNAPKFHVVTTGTNGATIWASKILTPSLEYSVAGYNCAAGTAPVVSGSPNLTRASTCFTPDTTKNTDGIDPGQSQNVLIAFNHISTGDDGIAIKSHTSPATSNIQILHNRMYYTHGMSIGSETDSGLSNVTIRDMTVDGFDISSTSGFRIKTDDSRGGEVKNVVVDGLCTRRVTQPLLIDSYYGNAQGSTNALVPNIHDITIRNVRNLDVSGSRYAGAGNASIGFRGYQYTSPTSPLKNITLDNVVFDSMPGWGSPASGFPALASNAGLTMGPGPVSFASLLQAAGGQNGFTLTDARTGTTTAPYDCSTAFVNFPATNAPMTVQ